MECNRMEWNLECCNKRPTIAVNSGHRRNLQISSFIARAMHGFQEQFQFGSFRRGVCRYFLV